MGWGRIKALQSDDSGGLSEKKTAKKKKGMRVRKKPMPQQYQQKQGTQGPPPQFINLRACDSRWAALTERGKARPKPGFS